MRKTLQRLKFSSRNFVETSPMVNYSFYHWNYLFPQGMETPNRQNRTVELPYPKSPVNRFKSVWIDTDVHPTLRVALDPYLSKLPLGRTVPRTSVDEAVADFKEVAPLVEDVRSRHGWLAKVIHLCAIHRNFDAAKDLWASECQAMYVDGSAVPPRPLVEAMLLCAASTANPMLEEIFRLCLKDRWNLTPSFDTQLWSSIVEGMGALKNSGLIATALKEAIDVQSDVDRWNTESLVKALNGITADEDYDYAKQFLFLVSERKVTTMAKRYVSLRSTEEDECPLSGNDKMYYHILWHARMRVPQQFSPRQLYFDYKSTGTAKSADDPKAKINNLIKDKIARWKEEGLLPKDYEYEGEVTDMSQRFRNTIKSEFWNKMEFGYSKKKRTGFTPGVTI